MLQYSNLKDLLNIYKGVKGNSNLKNYIVMKTIKDIEKPLKDFNQSRYVATEFHFYQF